MSILTTCRLADPYGNHLREIVDYTSLDYTLNCAPGGVGVLELTLPTSFDTSLLLPDGRIGVWRAIDGRSPYLDGQAIYTIETFKFRSGQTWIRAYHATGLLSRRIISYNAGSSYTSKLGSADDLIKTYTNENMLAGIVGVDRDGAETQADVSAYVNYDAVWSLGAVIGKSAARRNLLEACRELAEASATAGTYVTFEIVAPTESTLQLRTYATARGVDRRASSGQPIILREQAGVLENAELTIDYHEEATATIAGGTGEKENRLIATALDTARMGASPFGRKERFVDMSNVDDPTELQDEADTALWAGRPIITFTGDLIETPALTRGIQFDLGDMLTAEDPRTARQFDVRLEIVKESITPGGRKVQIGLRGVS